jgi:hypothetical protein
MTLCVGSDVTVHDWVLIRQPGQVQHWIASLFSGEYEPQLAPLHEKSLHTRASSP